MRRRAILALTLAVAAIAAAAPRIVPEPLAGDVLAAHDPVLARDGDAYYVYGTGVRARQPMSARTSTDLVHWRALPSPLPAVPDWARAAVPGARDVWAPDLSTTRGGYRLYYAVSTFGAQRSVIGLATSPTLDPSRRDYHWTNRGEVISSRPGDDYNAIDPAFFRDRQGGEWLAFGSYWSGLKLVRLDPATGKPAAPAARPIAIAAREPGHDAIEAPFIIDHGGWYWLIASFDHCCRGAASDYHVVVGRSRAVTGPYVDRSGRRMLDGGGTDLIRDDPYDSERFRGPGHAGYLHDRDGREYLVFHAYDSRSGGAPTLRLARLVWPADGWPAISPLATAGYP